MVHALNEDRVLQALERNDVTFSRPDSDMIQISQMLCSYSILIDLPVDGGSQYRYWGGGGQKLKWGHVA